MTTPPPVVLTLLGINFLVFLAMGSLDPSFINALALWPLGTPDQIMTPQGVQTLPSFGVWQLITYGFLHSGFSHIFFNMFGLWMFGSQVEEVWGPRRFLFYYLVCIVGAGIVQLITAAISGGIYPTIGASGAIFGILLAFGMLFPNRPVFLIFFPVPIPAKYMVIGYGLLELWAGIGGIQPGVAHFAHLGGMLFGFLLILRWRKSGRNLPPQWRRWR